MTLRVEVILDPRAIVRANDGLDLDTLGKRYEVAVRAAIEADLPGASVTVVLRPGSRGVAATVEGGSETENRATERTVLDLAWAVRETLPLG